MRDAVILSGVRMPTGKFMGALRASPPRSSGPW